MKCRYAYCKCGGEVNKEDAIKVGAAYYHKECNSEIKDKEMIRVKVKEILPGEMVRNINCFVKSSINDKNINPKFILYTLDYISRNKCKINNVYGLNYYVSNYKIQEEYDNYNTHKKYIETSNKGFETNNDEVSFSYNSNDPEWLKIL